MEASVVTKLLVLVVLFAVCMGQKPMREASEDKCQYKLRNGGIIHSVSQYADRTNTTEVDIVYPGGYIVDCGNDIPGNITVVQPVSISLNSTSAFDGDLVTIVFFSTPNLTSTNETYLNWLVANVKLANLNNGMLGNADVVYPYNQRASSDPDDFNDFGRRMKKIFFFYSQRGRLDPNSLQVESRDTFRPKPFALEHHLGLHYKPFAKGDPNAANYFLGTPTPCVGKGLLGGVDNLLSGCKSLTDTVTDTVGGLTGQEGGGGQDVKGTSDKGGPLRK